MTLELMLIRLSVLLLALLQPWSIAAGEVSPSGLDLAAFSVDGARIPNAYFAIIPDTEPWHHPTEEGVGSEKHWNVQAGTYGVVVGAPGYETHYETRNVGDAERHSLDVKLNPLRRLRGSLQTTDGLPIGAGHVVWRRDYLKEDKSLSRLGAAHLRSNWDSVSDAGGAFVVMAPVDQAIDVVAYAEGRAPLNAVVDPRSAGSVGTLTLREGATLGLSWKEPEPGDGRVLIVTDGAEPSNAYPISGLEDEWAAPSGEIRLMLVMPLRPPAELAHLFLRPGERKTLTLTHPETSLSPRLQLFLPGVPKLDHPEVWRIAHDGVAELRPSFARFAVAGTMIEVAAPCDSGATLLAAARNVMNTVQDAPCTAPLRMTPRPTAIVRARLVLPSKASLPRRGVIQCGTVVESPFEISSFDLAATVIAGCRRPRLVIDPFAPVEFSSLAAGERIDLGKVILEEGALARVRVVDDLGTPVPNARVGALRRSDLETSNDKLNALIEKFVVSAATDAQGRARLSGLPPGDLVFALQRAPGEIPVFSDVYRTTAGREIATDDLTLPRPASVTVRFNLPAGLRSQAVIQVQLSPMAASVSGLRVPGVVSTDGTARFAGIPPGEWLVRPFVRVGRGLITAVKPQPITLIAGSDDVATVDLSIVVFRGRVTRGGQPINGSIAIRSERVSRTATLEPDGAFVVPLDVAGDYRVRVQEKDGTTSDVGKAVSFMEPRDLVTIELPAGAVQGVVIDENGRGVGRVAVAAERAEAGETATTWVYSSTREDGSFKLPGIGAGLWRINAERGELVSDDVQVSAIDDRARIADVRLRLKRVQRVRIQVVSGMNGEPVPFALVAVTPPLVQQQFSVDIPVERTDEDGVAEFGLPSNDNGWLNIAVSIPGGAVFSARRQPSARILLEVPAMTGALTLRRQQGTWAGQYGRLVAEDGSSFGPRFGGRKEMSDGSLLTIDSIPAGLWRYYEPASGMEKNLLDAGMFDRLRPRGTVVVKAHEMAELIVQSDLQ